MTEHKLVSKAVVHTVHLDMGKVTPITGRVSMVLLHARTDQTTDEFDAPPDYLSGDELLVLHPDEARLLARALQAAARRATKKNR